MTQLGFFEEDEGGMDSDNAEAETEASVSNSVVEVSADSARIVFFDTETTGLGPEHRLCQLAYKSDGVEYESLFKPPLPIDPGASAVTGITDEMVASKEVFQGSKTAEDFAVLASAPDVYFVAHNAPFDVEMLSREGIAIERYIDTLRIVRAVDDGKAENYKQEYLWKYYDLQVEDARAHDALGDVRVLEALFDKLGELIAADPDRGDDVIAEMWKIMETPMLYKKIPFGKYCGMAIEDVAQKDSGYLEWLLTQKRNEVGMQRDEDWIYTLSHHLGKE